MCALNHCTIQQRQLSQTKYWLLMHTSNANKNLLIKTRMWHIYSYFILSLTVTEKRMVALFVCVLVFLKLVYCSQWDRMLWKKNVKDVFTASSERHNWNRIYVHSFSLISFYLSDKSEKFSFLFVSFRYQSQMALETFC